MKNVKKILDVWMGAWEKTNRKTVFPRVVNDALRKNGISAFELQSYISEAIVTKSKTKLQQMAVDQYLIISKEAELAKTEDLSETGPGLQFLLKAQHGYEDKQTVKVEDGNIADIIAKKSEHK